MRYDAASRGVSAARLVVTIGLAASSACGAGRDATAPSVGGPGTIEVRVALTGNAVNPVRLVVLVAGHQLGFTHTSVATVTNVPPGADTAVVSGLASNCVTDSATRHFAVQPGGTALVQFAVDCVGGFAYSRGKIDGADIMYLDERGNITQLTSGPGQRYARNWSPDGRHILVDRYDANLDSFVDVVSLDGEPTHLLSVPPPGYDDSYPQYSPDGKQVVFCRQPSSGQLAGSRVMIINADGTNEHGLLAEGPLSATKFDCYPSWSPDGARISFMTDRFATPDNFFQVATAAVDGSDLKLIASNFSDASMTAWSPDGKAIAFVTGVLKPVSKQFVGVVPAGGGPVTEPWLGEGMSFDFQWAPDASKLALMIANAVGGRTTYSDAVANADGSSPITLVPNMEIADIPRWSNDGRRLLVEGFSNTRARTTWIYIARPDGSGGYPLLQGTANLYFANWNPTARPGALDGDSGAK